MVKTTFGFVRNIIADEWFAAVELLYESNVPKY